MKLLFFAHNSHQIKYFNKIKENTSLNISVINRVFSFNIYYKKFLDIDLKEILDIKFYEIDLKYKNKIKNILYKKYLKIESLFIALGYIKYLNNKPDMVAFWNGTKYPQNIGVALAKKREIKTLFFENGALPDTTTMDFKGVNAKNSIKREKEFFKNFICEKELPKKLIPRKIESKRLMNKITLPKEFIFVPFQVNYDTQIIYHSTWVKNMDELFFLIDKISKELKINFILKEHPSDKSSNYEELHKIAQKNSYINFANSIDTQELIEKSKAIITINSSVGIEGLLFDKKVIVIGDAFYAIDDITIIATSEEELKECLKTLDNIKIDKELIKKFLCYLNQEYFLPSSWRKPTKEHFQLLEKRILDAI